VSLLIYNLLLPLGLLALLPSALRKLKQRGGSWYDLRQRFGLLDQPQRIALAAISHFDHRLWVHAVSVGEVGVATKLISLLLATDPSTAVVLTVTTPTGHQLAVAFAQNHPGRVAVLYSPIDFPPVVKYLLAEIAPRQLILVEAEIWPNLVNQARRAGIPVTLANARLSARSERRYRRLSLLTRPVFAQLSQVLVQEPEDITRWVDLGADPRGIHLTGSIKYDPLGQSPSPSTLQHLQHLLHLIGIESGKQRIILAASTHPGEDRAIAEAFLALQTLQTPSQTPTALLIVPRHVERSPQILRELTELELDPIRRSTLTPASPSLPFNPRRALVIDTTGELNAWQHLSDIVIIGKSFLAHGGQNPAEAAMARKPAVLGPHMENFEPLVKLLLDAGGAIQIQSLSDLPDTLRSLLIHPERAYQIGSAAHASLAKHAGSTQRTVDFLLGSPSSRP
jgi:3-deoxy-D-manno-octulosonic-acid transferase